jgi:hypothetical protein
MEVPDEQDQEPVQMEAPRFMAVVWGPGQAGEGPTTIVQLDGNGEGRFKGNACCGSCCWPEWLDVGCQFTACVFVLLFRQQAS